jgi:hypothetical protein
MSSNEKHRVRWTALGIAGVGAAGAAALARRPARTVRSGRSYAVVINLPEDKLRPRGEHLTPPLAEIAEHAEVTIEPTVEGRGSQVRAVTHDPGFDLRSSLRTAKQLLETGEALHAPPEPSGRGPAGRWVTERFDNLLASGGAR